MCVAATWTKGVRRIPHAGQDTNSSIESYHGAMKRWLGFTTKGLRGRRLDWLITMLTTTIHNHYTHRLAMKKAGLIKNEIMTLKVRESVNLSYSIDEEWILEPTNERAHWMCRSATYPENWYSLTYPHRDYACCDCEYAIRGNFCKHQAAIILKTTDVDQDAIVEYCGTYYGTTRGGLFEMFKAERGFCDEDGLDEDIIIDSTDTNHDATPNLDDLEIGVESLQENDVIEVDEDVLHARVIKEHAKDYKKFQRLIEGHGLRMAEHATSEFRVLLNRMSELCLADFQGTLHPDTQFANMDRGMGNSIRRKQGWYERMLSKRPRSCNP